QVEFVMFSKFSVILLSPDISLYIQLFNITAIKITIFNNYEQNTCAIISDNTKCNTVYSN
ncbi:hypothetical protein ACJX0J_018303, partial [Zea mays]